MESYCGHNNPEEFDDDYLLLDDENTSINSRCKQCRRKLIGSGEISNSVSIEGPNWIQNRTETLTGIASTPRLNFNNEHLDSPEDSPLLHTERYNEFGNLSIGEFHCHFANFKNVDSNKALKKLITVSLLCFLFMVTEFVGGHIAGSLAVMTDAAHLFSDLVGFVISMISILIGRKQPTRTMTFGYHRAEVLGAFISVLAIWIMASAFFILAVRRLIKSEYDIDPDVMLIVSALGLVVNIVMGAVLHGVCHTHSHGSAIHHGQEDDNINVRAAAAHVIGDIFQSVGVLFAAVIIKFAPNAKEADPICTVVFSVIVFCTTLKIAKDSFLILLEASPTDVGDLMYLLRNIHGVKHVHSVHVWTFAPGKDAVAAHLAVDDYCDRDIVLNQATYLINKRLKVISCHVQIEAFDQQLISSCMQCQELQC